MMRKGWAIIIFCLLSGQLRAQQNILDQKVSIRLMDVSVSEALDRLARETSLTINYLNYDVPKGRRVNKTYRDEELGRILRDVWGSNQLILRVQGSSIALQSSPGKAGIAAKGVLLGTITDENKEPLPGVTIRLVNTPYGAISDKDGRYELEGLKPANYQVEVSSIGFQKIRKTIVIAENETLRIDFTLDQSVSELQEIVVMGTTFAQELARQPIQITSVDLKPVQNQAVEVARILDDLPGVRVRQSGGFGSRTQVQLNGATGNAVRGYFDGIPFEYIASSGSINTLPVNLLDRIDVYKGVMPIEIGTDALAGGINFISRKVYSNLLDVSYEVGSFNTHRATLNTYFTQDSSFFIGFNGFYNYSDNNYEMDVTSFVFGRDTQGNFTNVIGSEELRVERFHDAHESFFTELHTGIHNHQWADELSYRIAYMYNFDETQHGVRVSDQPAGEADQQGTSVIQRLTYSKKGLFDGLLDICYQGTLNFLNLQTNDSTTNFYNWRGQVIKNFRGSQNLSEITPNPTARDIDQNATSQRLNVGLNIYKNHKLTLSYFYGRQRLEGEDPLIIGTDPNKNPATLEKNISGISYESQWFNKKLFVTTFGKRYQYTSETNDLFAENNSISQTIRRGDDMIGYGMGIKWVVNDDFFIRSSYEQTVRIPTPNELVGDFVTTRSNPFLRPEQSDNLNLGFVYSTYFADNSGIYVDFNSFLRFTDNLIFFNANELTLGQFINQSKAEARGIELALSGNFRDFLKGQLNITTQRIIDATEGVPTSGLPIPNRPDFLISSSFDYSPRNWFREDRQLSFGWFINFIDEFNFILTGGARREENFVPTQFINDFSTTYQMRDKGLSFSVQVNNIFDAEVFDFISVPRPGRNFRFKIRYTLNNF